MNASFPHLKCTLIVALLSAIAASACTDRTEPVDGELGEDGGTDGDADSDTDVDSDSDSDGDTDPHQYSWHTFHGADHPGDEWAYRVITDSDDNIYLVGYGSDPWTGPGGEQPLNPHADEEDALVIKLDSEGQYVWHTFFGNEREQYAYDIVIDSNGDLVIAGSSQGDWYGPDEAAPLYSYAGEYYSDAFVLKLDRDGEYLWHAFLGAESQHERFDGVAIDLDDNIYLAGRCSYSFEGPYGDGPINDFTGESGILVMKLDGDGGYAWHTIYGSSEAGDEGTEVEVATDGTIFVIGYSREGWTGPLGEEPLLEHPGSSSGAVLGLANDGEYLWHTFLGGAGTTYLSDLELDGAGRLCIVGKSYSAWEIGEGELPLNAPGGGENYVFAAQLDSTGELQWHTFFGRNGIDLGAGIALDPDDDIYLTGQSDLGWKGPNGEEPIVAHADNDFTDITVIKLRSEGDYLWHTYFGDSDEQRWEYGRGISVDSAGDVVVVGHSDYEWDGPSGEAPINPHTTDDDLWVMKLAR
jgi:hypothetical protein